MLIIPWKNMKYLGISQMKDVWNLYTQNYKTLNEGQPNRGDIPYLEIGRLNTIKSQFSQSWPIDSEQTHLESTARFWFCFQFVT